MPALPQYHDRSTLTILAEGGTPETVFGPDRPLAARQLRDLLDNIALDEQEQFMLAMGHDGYGPLMMRRLRRRAVAHRRGQEYLRAAYHGYEAPGSS